MFVGKSAEYTEVFFHAVPFLSTLKSFMSFYLNTVTYDCPLLTMLAGTWREEDGEVVRGRTALLRESCPDFCDLRPGLLRQILADHRPSERVVEPERYAKSARAAANLDAARAAPTFGLTQSTQSIELSNYLWANFQGLVLDSIEADFASKYSLENF